MNGDMLALAARVEALDGADREVDGLVGALLGLCAHHKTSFERCQGDSGYTCDDCGADSWGNKSKSGQRLDDKMPRFTASIDAAMSFAPEGCPVVLKQVWAKEGRLEWYVTINGYINNRWHWSYDALHVSPALALTAASLRARASMGGE